MNRPFDKENKPEHREFIDRIRQQEAGREPSRTWYLWQLIYRRRLQLGGVLLLIVLITFNPIKCMLSKENNSRSALEQMLLDRQYDKAITRVEELYKRGKMDRQEYYYFLRTAVNGKFDLLSERAQSAYSQRSYTEAMKYFRLLVDFVYENKAHLGISSSTFSAFQREIYDPIKYMPAEEIANKKLEDIKEQYHLVLEAIAPDADALQKLDIFFDALLKIRKMESTEFL